MNDAASPSPENGNKEPTSVETPQEVSPQITTTQGLDEAAVQKRGLMGVLQRLTPAGRRERAVARSQGGAEVVQLVRSLQVHLERQSEVMEVLPEAIKGLSEVVEASRKQSDQLEQVGAAMTKFNDTLFSMDNTTRRLVEGSRASEETLTQLLQKSERRFYGLAILLVVVVVLLGGTIAFLSNPEAVRSLSTAWSEPAPATPSEEEEPVKPKPDAEKPVEAVTPPSNDPKPEQEAAKPSPKPVAPVPNPVPPPKPEGKKPAPAPVPVVTPEPAPSVKPVSQPDKKSAPATKPNAADTPKAEGKPENGSKPGLKEPAKPAAQKDPASGAEKPGGKAPATPPKAPLKVSL